MKNTSFIFTLSVLLSLSVSSAIASYSIKVPLEVKTGGQLPDGSIIIGNGNNNGNGGNPPVTPVDPTDPEENACVFDLTKPTVYVEQTDINEVFVTQLHNGVQISNGKKGQVQSEYTSPGIAYYELCLNGESAIPSGPEKGWEEDGCRYRTMGNGNQYYWMEKDTVAYPGEKSFATAFTGDLGAIGYGQSRLTFPNGSIPTNEGVILPNDSSVISDGVRVFYKGSLKKSVVSFDGKNNYFYEVCKRTL